jgi:Mitochondrial carrier protein
MSEGGGGSKKVNPWVSLTTGCISGGIECIAVWPMEFIKTQLQLQKIVPGVKPAYTGLLQSGILLITVTNSEI